MKKIVMIASCFALALGIAIAADPTAKEVMQAGHGKNGLKGKIAAAVKGEKWDDAATAAKTYAEHGAALGKNEPKKGDKDSWKKLTKEYADNTAALAKAVEKKDAKEANAALGKIGGSCKACHDAHK